MTNTNYPLATADDKSTTTTERTTEKAPEKTSTGKSRSPSRCSCR